MAEYVKMTPAVSERIGLTCGLGGLQLLSWGTSFYIFGLILLPIEQSLNLNRNATALAFPIALAAEGLLSSIMGKLIAKGCGKSVMAGGSLAAGVGLLALGHSTSLVGFYFSWALIGASFSCTLYVPLFSIIATDYPASSRSKITAISLVTGFSTTFFLPLSDWILIKEGWRYCMMVYAALNIFICSPGYWILLNSSARHARRQPVDADSPGYRHPAPNHPIDRFGSYVFLVIFTSAISAISASLAAHIIPMLSEQGTPVGTALLAPAAIGALQTASRLPLLLKRDDKRIHPLYLIFIFAFPLSVLLLQFAQGRSVFLVAFVILYGMAHGAWTIIRATSVSLYIGVHGVAVLNGKIAFWSALARIALPAILACVWSEEQGYRYGYWLLLFASIVGFMAFKKAQGLFLSREAN